MAELHRFDTGHFAVEEEDVNAWPRSVGPAARDLVDVVRSMSGEGDAVAEGLAIEVPISSALGPSGSTNSLL